MLVTMGTLIFFAEKIKQCGMLVISVTVGTLTFSVQ